MAKVLDELPETEAQPLTDSEWADVITGAVDPAKNCLKALDTAKMLTRPPPPVPWLLRPLVARRHVTLLAGREGEGKSMLALAIAKAVERGQNLAGLTATHTGSNVLYVDAENGEHEIARRLHLLDVSPGVDFMEADGFSMGKNIGMLREAMARRMQFGHPVGLLVLDSLRSLWPEGEENDSAGVEVLFGSLRQLARDFDCAILVLHHLSKYGQTYRGSTALGAGSQLVTFLVNDKNFKDQRLLLWHKCRPCQKPKPHGLLFVDEGSRLYITEPLPNDGYDYE